MMDEIIGSKAVINKPDAITNQKTCTVLEYANELGKYKVSFDKSYVGWYSPNELNTIK